MAQPFRVIDGNTARDIAANDCLAEFAKLTEQVSVECPRMSGFVVVAFDDDGFPYSVVHFGAAFPIPGVMTPAIVKDAVTAHIYDGSGC